MVETDTAPGKHLLITGHVQGVGYRYSMRNVARELGLTGWCRNLPGGEVEAEVYGNPEPLDQLIRWCHQGPPHAQVIEVKVSPVASASPEAPATFDITR
jgi:acylphosphatase